MWRPRKIGIPLSPATPSPRSARGAGPRPFLKAVRLTTAICGSATFALVMVLGFALASGTASAPDTDEAGIVRVVQHAPAATSEPTLVGGATPFAGRGCKATFAVR